MTWLLVLWIWIDEEPEADRSCEGVTAREKMSVGWARGTVWVWRYCLDYNN
jgi:phage terminase large subunit-like protein